MTLVSLRKRKCQHRQKLSYPRCTTIGRPMYETNSEDEKCASEHNCEHIRCGDCDEVALDDPNGERKQPSGT